MTAEPPNGPPPATRCGDPSGMTVSKQLCDLPADQPHTEHRSGVWRWTTAERVWNDEVLTTTVAWREAAR